MVIICGAKLGRNGVGGVAKFNVLFAKWKGGMLHLQHRMLKDNNCEKAIALFYHFKFIIGSNKITSS